NPLFFNKHIISSAIPIPAVPEPKITKVWSSIVFPKIRAGTGGKEASIFSKDLFKMYNKFSIFNKWKFDVIGFNNKNIDDGFKEIIIKIHGKNVFDKLKFESGVHRVQRIPKTESQGRIHTSTCTIAILPETKKNNIEIKKTDLKIDTFRASGAGGQHVNKTDSAIRITHIPSKISVECQSQRSQHKNKAQALSILKAKLVKFEEIKNMKITSNKRKSLIGSGDRSERIRTYNFPKQRITDHRINYTENNVTDFMNGNIFRLLKYLTYEEDINLLNEILKKCKDY
ncbi:peptide chain release factor 1-like, partial [Palaemon carinicauda]|uniref:peptide chain release factor 1-like n=1 Tax=Palaemon carinicauda TaxID=392227 RepID=UPI0035B62478